MRRKRNDSGPPTKRDTPVKPAPTRRNQQRKFLPKKHYETFPEEPEEEEEAAATVRPATHAGTGTDPVDCEPALRPSRPALSAVFRCGAVWAAAPARSENGHRVSPCHLGVQATPKPETLKSGKTPPQDEQKWAVTPGSVMASRIESDTTFSSDDDDNEEDDCCSSASVNSGSYSSPEIFRAENSVETLNFPANEDLLDLHLDIKNSTLLNVGHAENIYMHPAPSVSTITDASTILADKTCEISHSGVIEPKTHRRPFQSDKALKRKTEKSTISRLVSQKKRVWFKSPVAAKQTDRHADTPGAGEISPGERSLHLMVTMRRPAKSCPGQATFFDFASDGERDEFFQRTRERCAKLKNVASFPLSAAKHAAAKVP